MITYHWSAVICLLLGHSAQKISSTDRQLEGLIANTSYAGSCSGQATVSLSTRIRERLAVGNALLVMRARELRLSGSM